jgi:tetratricopeptide (TPR) repeat protein
MIALESRIMQQDTELDLIRDELVKAMRLAEQGKHRQTIDLCVRTMKTATQKSLPLPEGFVAALLTRMGLSMAAQGEVEQAVLHYRLAEGVLLRRKESLRQVRERYEVVLYSTDDDLRLLLADIYQALGAVFEIRQEPDRSITYYRQAYKIAESMESIGLAWRALHAIAQNYQARNMWQDLRETALELLTVNARDPQPSREIIARRFLAQTYGKTSSLQEMLTELTRIVEVGRASGHPDLPYDERALARAQQTLNARAENGTAIVPTSSAPLTLVDGDSPRGSRTMEIPAIRPGTGGMRSVPTSPEATEMPNDLIHSIGIEMENEQGANEAIFVLQTRHFEHAASLFQWFRPALLAVNIPSMHQIPHDGLNLPSQGQLHIEWSLHDLKPNILLGTALLSEMQVEKMEEANRASRRLTIYLEGRDGPFGKRKRLLLPGMFEPYVLDWRGMTGVVRYMRRTYMQETEQLSPQEAHHLLTLLQLQIKEGLLATGIYREMGFIYRQIGDFDSALHCFREEIALSLGKDGIPGSHSAQSFRQMGLIFMEREEDDLAFDALRMALAINPNSFESLTALGTLVKDPAEALRYLGRAWRIRKSDTTWADVIKTAAARFNRTQQQIEQAVSIVAVQVDLSVRYEFERAALVRLGIV